MRPDIEKLKCEICEKESWVLYPIIFGRDHMFTPRKGVCKECFNKVEELDALLLRKNKKIIQDSINEKTESIKELNQELAELKALDDAVHAISETNSHPSVKRNKIEARDDASLNQDANVATGEGEGQ